MAEQEVELVVTDLAFDGKAVAHRDGKVVFLNGGLPGETVLAAIVKSKPRYDQAVVRRILTPSPMRLPARCSHFGDCGGCTWQDLDYRQQLVFKRKQVADCLTRLGRLEQVAVDEMIGCAELYNYRNKMEFSFHTAPGGFTLGLHRRGQFDDIFDLDRCYLQSELSNRIVRWIRDFVVRTRIPVYDVANHTGYMRFLVIRQGKRTGQTMVNVVTNYGDFPDRQRLVRDMRAELPEVTTLVHNQNGRISNIAVGESEQVLFGLGYIEEQLFDCRFRIRANSFFQTNSIQAETLYRTCFEMLRPGPSERVFDLYCGTGSIAILLAGYVQHVVGVELVKDAVDAAVENAACNNVGNVEFHHADVKDYLALIEGSSVRFDTVIVDPPRTGLHPKALRRLLRLDPPRILYVSCNPATFARDARLIVDAGYDLPLVRPVDMFPHTMHIELAGVFNRR
ncbi:MAG TPA: 23S rRNA (uracil(1939)-C(5))-methyltransferase RlmD [candidate division Zixibacteria bacterium]|mgnify:CR=1 FL=1|nr:23S rRNA (uracil(1939)-C(5))-methyltransferase RlmD [candidate division Zixibacteria bacterium]MDD4916736.1 23S rRNA (uracil(1939)-C(5))-methyltransferase RlmD [candidate division Zixibacteria bacterium]MDM7973823.1 23S rRNA (uracil(1939)-C(5))-methyltransferase RlmD [candidate division Zixibacteria bacterium]HOD65368.1 23S rRNA (uracil(1939)-C(5))-methyltransferase RlmD [candidate division Zixibacteria bacterium]HOZ07898.1 23S rRNA (uracil(1939)-C(5))-methyltransferase RlmD [candidate divis